MTKFSTPKWRFFRYTDFKSKTWGQTISSLWLAFRRFADLSQPPAPLAGSRRFIVLFALPLCLIGFSSLLAGPFAEGSLAQTADAATDPYKAIDAADTAWMLVSTALVLLMTPGLAFFYGGLVRSRNVLNTIMMSLVSMGVVGVTWVLWGYSLAFSHVSLNDKNFETGIGALIGGLNWIGLHGVDLAPDPGGIYAATIPHELFMLYQMTFAIITVALVSGAIVERISFKAYFWFLILWSTFIYSPLAHMVWGRGFLGSINALDFAGGTVVHISSGVSALVAAWMLGARKDHQVAPMLPHNVPFVLLGVGLLWFGWFGFNGGSALGIGGDVAKLPSATVAVVATTIAAAAAGLTWMLAEWLLRGVPTAVGLGSGFVAGLVGITPAAGFVTPLSALAIGAITALCCYGAVNLKAKLKFDDALDTFPVHGVGGTVGALLTGVFATKVVNGFANTDGLLYGNPGQLLPQLTSIIVSWVLAGVGTFIILKLLSLVMDLRVSTDVEDEGLDIHEHGEAAYGGDFPSEISLKR
ncbi:ammonium transporter [Synechococcus sp. PCC 6312]|uniref:ammonium transporter n=1 Tax=Synechococcus sp. (strain ATCC 27167 / PCC 6312) TaxID=195253 RepID=UPI00029ED216|nr:ammonium transporter [Synechococcus sp. PCC 6312]AFY59280.1 ammonium transporter [Synechococcus sp. PCC 6312]